jgi:hypothetical protein
MPQARMRSWRSWCRPVNLAGVRLWRATDGASAAEFAVIVPVLGLLLAGIMDLAQLANQGMLLKAGLRTGAGYALTCSADYPSIVSCTTRIRDAIVGSNTFPGTVTVSFLNAEGAPNSAGYPQFCTCGDGSAITCITDPEDEDTLCDPGPKHFYITIEVVESDLAPLLQWVGFPSEIRRILTVRVS